MKITISFTLPDDREDTWPDDLMNIEEALPEDAENFEWDTE